MNETNITLIIPSINELQRFEQLSGSIVKKGQDNQENQKDLDGSNGTNRAKDASCQIRANNDYEAILCWANEYKHSPQTERSYLKEGLRAWLWCRIDLKKPFSSMDRQDLEKYFQFLANPQARSLSKLLHENIFRKTFCKSSNV